MATAFSWSTDHGQPHREVKGGFGAQLGVFKRGPLLQKETSTDGDSSYTPCEMTLDPPNNQMSSALLFPLRDGGTKPRRGQVTHLRPHSKQEAGPGLTPGLSSLACSAPALSLRFPSPLPFL